MSYVEKNLLKEENVIKSAKIHWFIYVSGIAFLILSPIIFGETSPGLAGGLACFGMVLILNAVLVRYSTEFAITNRRVIAKNGFIARKTTEINISKIEGLGVDQSIFGRIFNYGTVTIKGTGGASAPFKFIADPLSLRHALNEQIGEAA